MAKATRAKKKTRKQPAKKSTVARGLRWVLTWALVLFIAAVLAVQATYFARVILLINNNPASSAFMQARAEQLNAAGKGQTLKHRWVTFDQVSVNLKKSVLVAEDARFAEHFGVDWLAIHRAWTINQAREGIAFGGSTITMQLAKNLYLSGKRSYWRKAQEVVIATMLELALGKERILELYLNLAQWGGNVFGAHAAAQHYYGVDAARLSVFQAARLAAMLPRPAYYDRNRKSDWLDTRTARIAADIVNVRLPGEAR